MRICAILVGYNELTFTLFLSFLDSSLYFQTVNNIAFCSLTILAYAFAVSQCEQALTAVQIQDFSEWGTPLSLGQQPSIRPD